MHVCMYVCIDASVQVCMYVCIDVCKCASVQVMCASVHVCIVCKCAMCMYVQVCASVQVCMYVCIDVCK